MWFGRTTMLLAGLGCGCCGFWVYCCCLLVVGYGRLLVRSCLSFASVFVIDCLLVSGWVDCMWCG